MPNTVMQPGKPQPEILPSYTRKAVQLLTAPLPIQSNFVLMYLGGKVEDGPGPRLPATHLGNYDAVPDY